MFLLRDQICLWWGVRFPPDHLEALVAVIDEGTFAAAATALGITQSAVSQRIKALESRAGQVLLVRSAPAEPTPAGAELVRIGRQLLLLDEEAAAAVTGAASAAVLTVEVNADSLATWFADVLAAVAAWRGPTLRLEVADQATSADMLRAGSVMAAVTADPVAVQGCSVTPLGTMRYVPVATPELLADHRAGRSARWSQMPVLRFDDVDDLQAQVLRAHGVPGHHAVPTHHVPSSEAFAHAVRAGLGWGVLPEAQLGTALDDGSLVRLPGAGPVDVPLFWQRWRIRSTPLDRLTDLVTDAARVLRRPR